MSMEMERGQRGEQGSREGISGALRLKKWSKEEYRESRERIRGAWRGKGAEMGTVEHGGEERKEGSG